MLLLKKKIQPQKGQILILTVILLPLFLIMTILVIEAGFLYIKQTQLQNAADAIVLAHIDSKADAEKIVRMNRTVDFHFENLTIPDAHPKTTVNDDGAKVSEVKLQEDVIPIFGKIFGDEPLKDINITVSSKAKDDKLIP